MLMWICFYTFFKQRLASSIRQLRDIVNFFSFFLSYGFCLSIDFVREFEQDSVDGTIVLELMVIVQITFQQGCELQKHPQKRNLQDMIKIPCNVENVQCAILRENPWAPKNVFFHRCANVLVEL